MQWWRCSHQHSSRACAAAPRPAPAALASEGSLSLSPCSPGRPPCGRHVGIQVGPPERGAQALGDGQRQRVHAHLGGGGRRGRGGQVGEAQAPLQPGAQQAAGGIPSPMLQASQPAGPPPFSRLPRAPAAGPPPLSRAAQTAGRPRPAQPASPAGEGRGRDGPETRGGRFWCEWRGGAGAQACGNLAPQRRMEPTCCACPWRVKSALTACHARPRPTSYTNLAAKAWSQERAGKLRSVSTRLQEGRGWGWGQG